MVRKRRGNASRSIEFGHSLFGSAGWLFADLMLAIAMAFLVANTVGVFSAPQPRPTSPSATPHCTQPPIDRGHPLIVDLTVDPVSLTEGSAVAKQSVRRQVLAAQGLAGQRAGIVILYAGNSQGSGEAISLDKLVGAILTDLGNQGFGFQDAVYLDEQEIGAQPTFVELKIYLFVPEPGCPPTGP